MITIKRAWRYLCNLQWVEKKQLDCKFCDQSNLKPIYQDDQVIAFDNIRLAGQHHWLIIPVKHIRDIESLTAADLPLLHHFEEVKTKLLETYYPSQSGVAVHSGFHRGRRPMLGRAYWPDIVSIHHLHLHVIVETRFMPWLFKYPFWLPLMWKSDKKLIRQLEHQGASGHDREWPRIWKLGFMGIILILTTKFI